MSRFIFDIEANNLYLGVTTIWCICVKDVSQGPQSPVETFYDVGNTNPNTTIEKGLERLSEATELVGHNIIDYDIPTLEKIYGWKPRKNCRTTDTLVKSRLQHPDRKKPSNYTGKGGPHSLEAWGYRVGRGKIDNEVWDVFSPTILRRCREDVEINYLTDISLSSEAVGHNWTEAQWLEQEFQRIVSEQAHYGVEFDSDKATKIYNDLTKYVEDIDKDLVPKLPATIKQIGQPIMNPFKKTGGYTKRVLDWYYDGQSHELVKGPFTKIEIIPFNLSSTMQVKEYLLEHGWEPTEWNYSKKTGERTSPKLTEDSFESVAGEMPRLVKERTLYNHRRATIQGWF